MQDKYQKTFNSFMLLYWNLCTVSFVQDSFTFSSVVTRSQVYIDCLHITSNFLRFYSFQAWKDEKRGGQLQLSLFSDKIHQYSKSDSTSRIDFKALELEFPAPIHFPSQNSCYPLLSLFVASNLTLDPGKKVSECQTATNNKLLNN
jgi:hypothetical protein